MYIYVYTYMTGQGVQRHPPRNLPAPFNMNTHRQLKTEVTCKMKPQMPESKSRQCSGSADIDLSTLEAPDDHANAISADPMWKMACAGHCRDICQGCTPGPVLGILWTEPL